MEQVRQEFHIPEDTCSVTTFDDIAPALRDERYDRDGNLWVYSVSLRTPVQMEAGNSGLVRSEVSNFSTRSSHSGGGSIT